jgi:hypothetical protein
MALFSFGQKKDQTSGKEVAAEKKIEFAQKLPSGELEGRAAPKGGDFDFLKNFESRTPGEKAPIEMAEAAPPEEAQDEEESVAEKKPKQKSWLSGFLKFSVGLKRDKNPSRVLEVNLVKGEIVKFFDWQRGILIILVAVFVTMAVLSGIYWGISWWGASSQNSKNNDYLQRYYGVSKEIKDLSPQVDQILVFKIKLDQVNFLLERHIYWTNFFDFLEKNTLSNVYFSGFSGAISSNYSLSATTDNFDAIDAQIKKLLVNQFIKGASVDSGTVSGQQGKPSVSFSLSFALDPKVFLYQEH